MTFTVLWWHLNVWLDNI